MEKSADAFRTISEVSKALGTPAHVLRFWESRFPEIAPVKRAGGRRYYRPEDVKLLGGIKAMLHDQGQSIRTVQDVLAEKGIEAVAAESAEFDFAQDSPGTEEPGQPAASRLNLSAPVPAAEAESEAEIAPESPADLADMVEEDPQTEDPISILEDVEAEPSAPAIEETSALEEAVAFAEEPTPSDPDEGALGEDAALQLTEEAEPSDWEGTEEDTAEEASPLVDLQSDDEPDPQAPPRLDLGDEDQPEPPVPVSSFRSRRASHRERSNEPRQPIQGFFFNDLEEDVLPPAVSADEKDDHSVGAGFSALEARVSDDEGLEDQGDIVLTDPDALHEGIVDEPVEEEPLAETAVSPLAPVAARPSLPKDPPAAEPTWPAPPGVAATLRGFTADELITAIGTETLTTQGERLTALRKRLPQV